MTTSVTVKTCSWPVVVSSYPLIEGKAAPAGEWTEIGRLEPNAERTFYVHSGIDLLVQELPLPEQVPTA